MTFILLIAFSFLSGALVKQGHYLAASASLVALLVCLIDVVVNIMNSQPHQKHDDKDYDNDEEHTN